MCVRFQEIAKRLDYSSVHYVIVTTRCPQPEDKDCSQQ